MVDGDIAYGFGAGVSYHSNEVAGTTRSYSAFRKAACLHKDVRPFRRPGMSPTPVGPVSNPEAGPRACG